VKKTFFFVIILIALFSTSCSRERSRVQETSSVRPSPPVLLSKALGPGVHFKINPVKFWVQGGVLEPHPSNSGCPSIPGTGRGCVEFETGTYGVINLSMFGGNPDHTCADTPQPDYVIVKVELTDKGAGEKGSFPLTLPALTWLVDAFPTMDSSNGVVYEADPASTTSPPSKSADFVNLNNNVILDGIKTSWYRVTVRKCSDGTELVSDPSIPNHGNN
jgi:hypothetical protein